MNDVSVYIQAGGQSSRMGPNKALLPLGSSTCIERVLTVAKQISTRIAIVANDPITYQFLDCPIIPDLDPSIGPLGGIHAALQQCPTDWALILGCDLPFLSIEVLRYLIQHRDAYDVVVPRNKDGWLQPLSALYARACLPQIVRLIASKKFAPRALFPHMRTRIVEWSEISSRPGAELFFFDMNTPENYEYAKHLLPNLAKDVGEA